MRYLLVGWLQHSIHRARGIAEARWPNMCDLCAWRRLQAFDREQEAGK